VGVDGVAPFATPAAGDKATPARSTATRRTLPAAIVAVVVLGAAAAYLLRAPHRIVRPWPDGPDAAAVPAFAGRPAIAVLPLDNLSPTRPRRSSPTGSRKT
jgi:hypothetical protein